MAKSKNLTEFALRVGTYAELGHYAQAFAEGHFNLLIVRGSHGLGKSQCFRRAVGENACWIDGNVSPFGIYIQAFEHRDQPIVLDDVDGLYRDRNGTRLLKALCQTDALKSLCWHTDAPTLERRGIPRQFTTTSKVAIITNQWKSLNPDVAALEDRGHLVHFVPSALEIHRQAGEWFWDQEIFDFVAANLHLMKQPSLRTYVLGWEQKRARFDWRNAVLSRCLTGTSLTVARLKSNPRFQCEEDRAQAFVVSGAGCRASYFNHAKKLEPVENIPQIKLLFSAPGQRGPQQYGFTRRPRRILNLPIPLDF